MKIRPPLLKEGDRIGIIAPAGPVSQEELRPGLEFLESVGFEPVCAPHLYDRKGYLAGEDKARIRDLHAMFRDRRIKAVLCARGGYGTHRILQELDYELFRRDPKIVVGYSDITALLLSFHAKTGLVTFHGPMSGSTWNTFNLDWMKRVLWNGEAAGKRDNRVTTGRTKGRANGAVDVSGGAGARAFGK